MEKVEIWKDIDGHKGYQISNIGRVRSLDRDIYRNRKTGIVKVPLKGRILTVFENPKGYSNISLGSKCVVRVHRLVAIAFIPNPKNKPCINHKDFNRSNNNFNNLEWVTHQENIDHAIKYGNFNYKLNKEQILEIRRIYIKGKRGFGCYALAKRFNVQSTCIFNIVNRNTYKHF